MDGIFNVGDTGRRWVNQVCCLVDNGQRCLRQAGNASYSRRIQKTVLQQRLKLNLDHAARHIYICDYHKDVIQSVRIVTPLKKSKASERGTSANKFVTASKNASTHVSTNRFQDLPIFTTSLPSYTTQTLGSTIILNQAKLPSAGSSSFISLQTPIVNQPIRLNNITRPTIISNVRPSTSNISYSIPNRSQPISYLTQSISSMSNSLQSASNTPQSLSNAPQSMSTHQQSAFKNVATSRQGVESHVQSYLLKPLSSSISGNISQIRPATTPIRLGGSNSTFNPVTYKIAPQIISTNLSNNYGPVLQLVPQNAFSVLSPNTLSEISPNTFSVVSRTTKTDSAVSSNSSFVTAATSNITAVVSSDLTRPTTSNSISTTSLTTTNARPVTFSYLAPSKPLDIGSYVIDGSAIGSSSESHSLNSTSRTSESNLLNLKLKTSESGIINSKLPTVENDVLNLKIKTSESHSLNSTSRTSESNLLKMKLKTSESGLINCKLPTIVGDVLNLKIKTSENGLINSKLPTTECDVLSLKLKTCESGLINSKLPTTESDVLNLKLKTCESTLINSKLPTTENNLLNLKLKTSERNLFNSKLPTAESNLSSSKLDFSESVEANMPRDFAQPTLAKFPRSNQFSESSKSENYDFDEPNTDPKASVSNKLSSIKSKFLNTIGAKKKNAGVYVPKNKSDFESQFSKDNKKTELDSHFPLKKSSFKKKSTSTPFYRKFFKSYSRLGSKLVDHTPVEKKSDNAESDSRKSDNGCDLESRNAAKSDSKHQEAKKNLQSDVVIIELDERTNSQNDSKHQEAKKNSQSDVVMIESDERTNSQNDSKHQEAKKNSQSDVVMIESEERTNSQNDVIMTESKAEINSQNEIITVESDAEKSSQNEVITIESEPEMHSQDDVLMVESEPEMHSQEDVLMVESESKMKIQSDIIMIESDIEEQNENIQKSDSDVPVAEKNDLTDPDKLSGNTVIHSVESETAEGECVSGSGKESEEEGNEEEDEEESDTSQSASSESSSEAEEEEEEEEDEESEKNYGPPPVHLNQLHIDSLRRYKQFFGVKTKKCRNKKELASQLQKHFSDLDVGEEEALSMFIYTVKTRSNLL